MLAHKIVLKHRIRSVASFLMYWNTLNLLEHQRVCLVVRVLKARTRRENPVGAFSLNKKDGAFKSSMGS